MSFRPEHEHKPLLDLDDAFEDLMRQAHPDVAQDALQYRESRRMFFAGAATVYFYTMALIDLSEDQAEAQLCALQKQIDEFFKARVAQDKD